MFVIPDTILLWFGCDRNFSFVCLVLTFVCVCVGGWWEWEYSYLVGTFSGRELFEKDQ